MEQSFVLKYYGGYTTLEQALMTAEERVWYIERIQKELKKQNESGSKGFGGANIGGSGPR